jgi:hypothetical protein
MAAVLTKVIFGTTLAQGQTQKAVRNDDEVESEVAAMRSRLTAAVCALSLGRNGSYNGKLLADSLEVLRDATGLELDEPSCAWAKTRRRKGESTQG